MSWILYDDFAIQGAWPGQQWTKADIGSGPLWDPTAIVLNRGEPDPTLTVRIQRFTLFRPPTHGKALMLSTKLFDVGGAGEFAVRCEIAVEIFGTYANPYGVEPGDPRLASGAMVTLDVETGVVLDFLITNDRICAVYERLGYAQAKLGSYPAFTHMMPTSIATSPGQWHRFEIRYDRARDSAEWWIDDELAASHGPIGAPPGEEGPIVKLSGIRIGGSLFTLIDGGVPRGGKWEKGIEPLKKQVLVPEDELFGQGGQISFRQFATRV